MFLVYLTLYTLTWSFRNMSRCWLCEFNKDAEAIRMSRFLMENSASMGIEQLAQCVHERLVEVDPNGQGHSMEQVKEHITLHILTPNVKVACILRSLINLMDKLEQSLITVNEDETTVIDSKNVSIYLKVISEIMQIYKTGDCSKLTFAETRSILGTGK